MSISRGLDQAVVHIYNTIYKHMQNIQQYIQARRLQAVNLGNSWGQRTENELELADVLQERQRRAGDSEFGPRWMLQMSEVGILQRFSGKKLFHSHIQLYTMHAYTLQHKCVLAHLQNTM